MLGQAFITTTSVRLKVKVNRSYHDICKVRSCGLSGVSCGLRLVKHSLPCSAIAKPDVAMFNLPLSLLHTLYGVYACVHVCMCACVCVWVCI